MTFENSVKNVDIHIKTNKNQASYITWDNPEYLQTYV